MHIFNWNDGPVDMAAYAKLQGKIVFVVDSPSLHRLLIFTQTDPILIHTGEFSWTLSTEELAAWCCALYDGNVLRPRAASAICQRSFGTGPETADERHAYLKQHLGKFNFVKLYDESVATKAMQPDQLRKHLANPALQTHLRQSILERHPDIVLYFGCSWVHDELFYRHKWNLKKDQPTANSFLKHHNEIVYLGFQPEPRRYQENYEALRSLIEQALTRLEVYHRGA